MKYNTLHIFGYGEIQVITDTENKKVATDLIVGVQLVVDDIYSKKPSDNPATNQYRTITILNDMFADYSDEDGNSFRVDYSELNAALIDALVEQVLNK
jgi:uridylate kinase